MIDPSRNDPRMHVPGPPGGTRFLCPHNGCLWFVDVAPSWPLLMPVRAVDRALQNHLWTHLDLTGMEDEV